MKKRVLVLSANPKKESFINYLAEAYSNSAEERYEVQFLKLSDMEFNIDVSDLTQEDAESVNSFEPIPEGRYTLEAQEWEVKTSKNNNQYIAVTFIVVSKAYEKRKIWQNYAVGAGDKGEFARKLVKAWALATGQNILAINKESLNSLKGRPFEADVGIEKSEGYKPKNKNY